MNKPPPATVALSLTMKLPQNAVAVTQPGGPERSIKDQFKDQRDALPM
jgi:hypothetical protein